MSKSNTRTRFLVLLICAILIHGSCAAAWAKDAGGSNKAAKINAVFHRNEERGYPFYALSVDYRKTWKLAKKNTFSGSFLIQKKLLKNVNDTFVIFPEVECFLKSGKSAGTLSSGYMIAVIRKKKGYSAYIVTETAFKKAGKKASVKKSGKNLMIRINDIPLAATDSGLAANKSYVISPTVWFLAEGADPAKGSVWTDSISIKGQKKQTITFDRKDYQYLHGITEDGTPVEVEIKAAGK